MVNLRYQTPASPLCDEAIDRQEQIELVDVRILVIAGYVVKQISMQYCNEYRQIR